MAPATSSTSQQQPKTSAKWPRSSPCRGKQWPEEECRRSPLLSNEDFINSIGRFRPKQPNRQHTAGMAWKADVNSVAASRSEEHTSELQSLMRISYAVFCLKKTATTEISHYLPTPSLHDALPISTTNSTSQQQPKTSAKWPRSSPCRGKQWPEEECRRSPLLSNEDFINSIGRFRPKQPNRQHTAGMAWKADVNSVAAS